MPITVKRTPHLYQKFIQLVFGYKKKKFRELDEEFTRELCDALPYHFRLKKHDVKIVIRELKKARLKL